MFQTLGLNSAMYTRPLRGLAILVALAVTSGHQDSRERHGWSLARPYRDTCDEPSVSTPPGERGAVRPGLARATQERRTYGLRRTL
jgi:hypothetical protein